MTQPPDTAPLIRVQCLKCGAQHVVHAPATATGEQFVPYPPCRCSPFDGGWAIDPAEADA